MSKEEKREVEKWFASMDDGARTLITYNGDATFEKLCDEVDWEQRQFEMFKSLMQGLCIDGEATVSSTIDLAARMTDAAMLEYRERFT